MTFLHIFLPIMSCFQNECEIQIKDTTELEGGKTW